jgi:hypothetical protein
MEAPVGMEALIGMSGRPRLGLGRVLDDLGTTLLAPVHGDPDLVADIGGVTIHDPLDDSVPPRHALVLGVGLHDPADIAAVLGDLGRKGAAALVVRAPVPRDRALAAAAERSGVAVVALARGPSWAQVAALLRTLLESGAEPVAGAAPASGAMAQPGAGATAHPVTAPRGAARGTIPGAGATPPGPLAGTSGIPAGDLFAVANATASLVDAPVTIEDRGGRVLAFSGDQQDADQSRVETILDRQVPERYARIHAERGVYRELYRSTSPVWIEPLPLGPGQRPRVAVAVRAGDEILGSIWVAVREPLSDARTRALRDAATLVGLHMLRARAETDLARRLRADLLSTALGGGADAEEALRRMRLEGRPLVVCALAISHPADLQPTVDGDARLVTERQRISDGFAMHLSAAHPCCATALLGDVAYGLVPVESHRDGPAGRDGGDGGDGGRGEAEDRVVRIAEEFLARIGERVRAVIGVGPVAFGAGELTRARACADRVVRVLCSQNGDGGRVARLADVHGAALVLGLRDLVTGWGDRPTGPLARLLAYDERHDSQLVATLRAWLDAFGDVNAAAAAVYVHPSTFRYRLRRLVEVGGLDLADPEARFTAQLQLRVVDDLACSEAAIG